MGANGEVKNFFLNQNLNFLQNQNKTDMQNQFCVFGLFSVTDAPFHSRRTERNLIKCSAFEKEKLIICSRTRFYVIFIS